MVLEVRIGATLGGVHSGEAQGSLLGAVDVLYLDLGGVCMVALLLENINQAVRFRCGHFMYIIHQQNSLQKLTELLPFSRHSTAITAVVFVSVFLTFREVSQSRL